MKRKALIYPLICFSFLYGLGQKIDTDSLLQQGIKSFRGEAYTTAIMQGRLGIKEAPEYYDFYLLLGRTFARTGKKESALYYFQQVVERAPIYREAFHELVQLYMRSKAYVDALGVVEKALAHYPDSKAFSMSKLKIVQLLGDESAVWEYLQELLQKYPGDINLQQLYKEKKARYSSDRIGVDYSYSFFNRDGAGPWHLTGIQYIRERKPFSLVGRINYANRRAQGESLRSGYQFVLESYVKTGEKGNSYISASYSADPVFPEFLLFYSYIHNFDSGWETDIGTRYIRTSMGTDVYVGTLGVGKYLGSSWLNLQSFLFFDNGQTYPAFTGTWRYYFNTKYDYIGLLAGYGSSPDESPNIIQFDERAALDSYRAGALCSKLLGQHFILGLQCIYNRQEYVPNRKQNQFDVFLSLQYKL
ncbi:MAG: YaiO family outer membrane beta-barrel protein [Bacteroidota bacterium]